MNALAWFCGAVCLIAGGCHSRPIDLARDSARAGAGGGGAKLDGSVTMIGDATSNTPDAANADSSTLPRMDAGLVARCGNAPCACDDGLDNDKDGLIDGLDPECTGALDQDEATFATGNGTKTKNCRDCFWDEDQGMGNDACRYPSVCLQGVEPPGNGSCGSCQVAQKCVDTCAARTPSGCDCFGCCEVARPNGVTVRIELTERCSLDKIDDTSACPRCTQSSQCRNPCGRCELCPGRTLKDLPADCSEGKTPNVCDEGQPVCEMSVDCPSTDQYCQQGCCFVSLL